MLIKQVCHFTFTLVLMSVQSNSRAFCLSLLCGNQLRAQEDVAFERRQNKFTYLQIPVVGSDLKVVISKDEIQLLILYISSHCHGCKSEISLFELNVDPRVASVSFIYQKHSDMNQTV